MKRRPKDVTFSGDHLWLRLDENNEATIGVTDYLISGWEEINKLTLPKKGQNLDQDSIMGEIEVDSTFVSVYAPASGKVLEVNSDLLKTPSLIIEDCFEDGWLIRIKLEDPSELETLMSNEDYDKFIEEEDEESVADDEEDEEENT
ncbi:MAG: glycine cleavage system protein H [Candidatus Brocadiia bacterium]